MLQVGKNMAEKPTKVLTQKLCASKIDSYSVYKGIVDIQSKKHLGQKKIVKLTPVDFILKVPEGKEMEAWTHKVKGSFIEYTLAHMLRASGRDGEIKQIRRLSEVDKGRFAAHYTKTTTNTTDKCLSSLLVCSLSHYLSFWGQKITPDVLKFYLDCADSSIEVIAGLQASKLKPYISHLSGYSITTGESVSSSTIAGATDFIGRKAGDVIILDAKYRTETPGVNQLLVYAALLNERSGEKATKIGIINPKKGEVLMYDVLPTFYLESSDMLQALSKVQKKELPVVGTATESSVPKVRSIHTNSKASKKKRKPDESKMNWGQWLAYKLFNVVI